MPLLSASRGSSPSRLLARLSAFPWCLRELFCDASRLSSIVPLLPSPRPSLRPAVSSPRVAFVGLASARAVRLCRVRCRQFASPVPRVSSPVGVRASPCVSLPVPCAAARLSPASRAAQFPPLPVSTCGARPARLWCHPPPFSSSGSSVLFGPAAPNKEAAALRDDGLQGLVADRISGLAFVAGGGWRPLNLIFRLVTSAVRDPVLMLSRSISPCRGPCKPDNSRQAGAEGLPLASDPLARFPGRIHHISHVDDTAPAPCSFMPIRRSEPAKVIFNSCVLHSPISRKLFGRIR